VLARLDADGCSRYVVTDVRRDGTLTGPNVELLASVTAATDRPVIASGGVSNLDDLQAISQIRELKGRLSARPSMPGRSRCRKPRCYQMSHPMTLAVRVIPCLDVDAGRVVKGVNFTSLRDAGDPVEMARLYDAEGADELVFLDITASSGDRETTYDVVRRTAEQVFIPLTVGGGVRSPADVDRLLRAGADKVGINTAAIERPELLTECAERFGRQCIVLSVDARRVDLATSPHGATPSGFEVTTTAVDAAPGSTPSSGRPRSGARRRRDPAELDGCRRHHGRLRHRDGHGRARRGQRPADRERRRRGGRRLRPGRPGRCGCVLAASVFHFGTLRIGEVKAALREAGLPVR